MWGAQSNSMSEGLKVSLPALRVEGVVVSQGLPPLETGKGKKTGECGPTYALVSALWDVPQTPDLQKCKIMFLFPKPLSLS